MFPSLLILLTVPGAPRPITSQERFVAVPILAAKVDSFVDKHWQEQQVKPTAPVGDAGFLRRLTLDLAGRIPTPAEVLDFSQDRSPDKRARAIRRLMESPEYPLHLGRVLDEMIQGKQAGDPEFLEYLRTAVAEHRSWDRIFRDIMLGPWDTKESKRSSRFLTRRLNSIDDLTNDTARVFFGVNVSCAKCHNHPLVPDWTQDHYFGMASFFNPTYEGSKGKGKNAEASVQEKASGAVMFVTNKGERRTAKLMFLSSRVVEDGADKPAAAAPGRREQLVKIALEDQSFFRRAIVNKLWAYLMGRGLVNPVDQMHSANPPSIPGLLEWLADDLAGNGYDLDRLIAALVSSRAYQLASTKNTGAELHERDFAAGHLRPLSPQQFALSLVLASSDDTYDQTQDAVNRGRRFRDLEGQGAKLTRPLDPRTEKFQSSTGEALFLSNHAEIQRLVEPAGSNLAARLATIADTARLVDLAVLSVLSRPAEPDERTYLVEWLESRKENRARACSQLVWALLTSAEFRFNH